LRFKESRFGSAAFPMTITSRLSLSALLALGLIRSAAAAVETYRIDPVHSSVAFSIRHFVSKVTGKFSRFSGTLKVDRDNLANSSVEASIETASINTDNRKRDDHLQNADFFEVAKYPAMTFKSRSWVSTGASTFDVTGDLTLKGVTREVVLKVTLLGFGPGMRGAQLSGWEATATIDKKQFNMPDPPMLDAALGDEVAITINLEAIKI
jgi:polyisoprenoid-binding protein YceI